MRQEVATLALPPVSPTAGEAPPGRAWRLLPCRASGACGQVLSSDPRLPRRPQRFSGWRVSAAGRSRSSLVCPGPEV